MAPFGTYAEFQSAPSSEKIVLAVLEARRRMVGWVPDAGSVYKIESFSCDRVVSIEDSGTAYVAAASASPAAGQYYHDREAGVLYLRASDSSNPNSRYLVLTENLYFSNVGISAPYDHGTWTGYEVYWRDGLESTSEFGVELDSENQLGEALDGNGSFAFVNDQEFWKPIFEKKSFANVNAYAYSWSRELPITEAKRLYRGKVSGKTYTEGRITFKLVDRLAELRASVALSPLSELVSVRLPTKLNEAFQRRIYGEAKGVVAVSLDHLLDNYPLAGTITNQVYSVSADRNWIDLKEVFGGAEISVQVPAGNYTTTTLGPAIKAAIEAATVQDVTVSYDSSTGKWSFQGSGAYLAILWETGTHAASSIGDLIGFNASADSGHTNVGNNQGDQPFLGDRAARPRGIVGVGTSFLAKLSPGDQILVDGLAETVTVETIESDVLLTTAEEIDSTFAGSTFAIKPELPKRYANRSFIIAGHALREPSTTVTSAPNTGQLEVADSTDLEAESDVLVGSELVEIRRVSGLSVRLNTNLEAVPANGTVVKRLSLSNVRLNSDLLTYDRDYSYDAATGQMSLEADAEFNVAPTKSLSGTLSFTNGSRKIVGTGTAFKSELDANSWVRARSQSTWYEVLQVISDTELWVRVAVNFTVEEIGLYRSPKVYDEKNDKLACDVLGATENGLKTGTWIKTAPAIVKHLLTDAGLSGDLEASTFTAAADLAYQRVGLVIPKRYDDRRLPTYREVIAAINKSVFGSLIQTPDFKYEYHVLRPRRVSGSALRLDEADALTWSIKAQLDKIVKTVRVEYLQKEFDPETLSDSSAFESYTSKLGNYLAKATKQYDHESLLVREADAETLAQRLAFLLASAYTTISVSTKLQTARAKIADVVDFQHSKIYERDGSAVSRKIGQIRAAKRDASGGTIEIEDLANAFTQCGTITEEGAVAWNDASEQARFFHGFITDEYGMIDNDADTYGVNRIW